MHQPTCRRCTHPLTPGAKFCTHCGQPAAGAERGPSQSATMPYGHASDPTSSCHFPGRDGASVTDRVSRGRRTQPYPERSAEEPRDTAFVLDCSGSMDGAFREAKNKCHAAQDATIQGIADRARLSPDDRVSIITFASDARVIVGLTPIKGHLPRFVSALRSIRAGGGTNMGQAMRITEDQLNAVADGRQRQIILLSDGKNNGEDPQPIADRLKAGGVVIHVVGIGANARRSGINESLMIALASTVDGQPSYRFLDSASLLSQHFSQLATTPYTRA